MICQKMAHGLAINFIVDNPFCLVPYFKLGRSWFTIFALWQIYYSLEPFRHHLTFFQEGSRDRGRRLFSLANLKSGKDKMMFVFEGDIELS